MEFKNLSDKLRTSGPLRLRKFFLFCIFLGLATLLTWIVGTQDNRYIALEHEGYGEIFPSQLKHWTKVGGSRLEGSDRPTISVIPESGGNSGATFTIALPESLPPDYTLIRVRSIADTLMRPSDPSLATDAGVLLRQLDKNDRIFQHRWVSRLTGEFNTHRDEFLTSIEPRTAAIKIRFSNRKSDGSFSLESVHLDIVKTSHIYTYVVLPFLLLMWAVLLVISAVYVAKKSGRKTMLALACIVAFMLLGILLPTSLRDLVVNPIFDQLKAIGLAGNNLAMVHYYKAGHFLVFFLVSLLLFYNAKTLEISKLELFGVMALVAIATEGAQLHLFFRSTRPMDIVIDIAGVALALLVYRATHEKLNRRKPDRPKRRKRKRTKRKAFD
ncbi:MAG: VanZ family protein [Granulosicoccus sp.]